MSSALRLTRLIGQAVAGGAKTTLLSNAAKSSVGRISVAGIVSVEKQDESFKRPAPFDYKKCRYTKVHRAFPFLDPTHLRMNANSKIVTVEGNIGSDKAEVAKQLAEKFGWHYMPEPKIDDLYVNPNGFDYRSLNQYIGEKMHAIDEKMFYENPKHPAVAWMKVYFYRIRYAQYIDALAHLFNTGQGVVLERNPGSDFVFTEAMFKTGLLDKDFYDYYFRLRYNTIHQLLRPHLIVYLDCDVDSALKRIKERNVPHEVKSSVLSREYLQNIEEAYKQKYLPDAANYSELVMYKWNTPGSIDQMVFDIEHLQMDDWSVGGDKFKDWYFFWDTHWHNNRWTYTNMKSEFLEDFNSTLIYDVDSLVYSSEEAEHRDQVYKSFITNYGCHPKYDSQRVGLFTQMFGIPNFQETEEFWCRGPFY